MLDRVIMILALLAILTIGVNGEPDADAEPDSALDEALGVVVQPNTNNNAQSRAAKALFDSNRAVVTEEKNQQRQTPTTFTLNTKPQFGLFVQGEKVTIVSESTAQHMTLAISLPDNDERKRAEVLISKILAVIEKQQTHAVLASPHTYKYRKQAIRTNIASCLVKLQNLKDGIKTIQSYLVQPNGVYAVRVPQSYSRFCVSEVSFELERKLNDIYVFLLSLSDQAEPDKTPSARRTRRSAGSNITSAPGPTTPIGRAEARKVSKKLATDLLEILGRIEKFETVMSNVISVLESLTNGQVNHYTKILMQMNQCLPEGALESTKLEECTIVRHSFTCSIQIAAAGKTEKGRLMIPVLYPEFHSDLQEIFVRKTTDHSKYSAVSKCAKRGNQFTCSSVQWKANKCITFDQSQDLQMILQHCRLTATTRKNYRSITVKDGMLIDNLGPHIDVIIEDKHKINLPVMLVPYTYNFVISPRTDSQKIAARLPFQNLPILTTWFGEEHLQTIREHIQGQAEEEWFDLGDNEAYQIYTLIMQLIATPILIKTLWNLGRKQFYKRIRKIQRDSKLQKNIKEEIRRHIDKELERHSMLKEVSNKKSNLKKTRFNEEEFVPLQNLSR